MKILLSIIIAGVIFATVFGIGMMFIDANAISSTNETQFQLKVNQTFSIESYGITIKFLNVISDSRCPSDVTCIWQGEAKVLVNIIENNQDHGNFILSTLVGHDQIVFGTHTLHLMQVKPFILSTKKISSNDYVITLVMSGVYVKPPLKQFKSGIASNDVKCGQGLQLVIKAEDSSPACVKHDTANILIERGWATNTTQPNHMTSAKINDPFGITALIIYHPSLGCLGYLSNATMNGCPPNNFYLKINSNSTAYLLGYNICDGKSCAKSNDLSVLLPINILLKPNDYQMIGLPVNLQWKYGDTVNIQLEVSPNADNKTASLIDLGNSTIVP